MKNIYTYFIFLIFNFFYRGYSSPLRLVGWGNNSNGIIPDGSQLYYTEPSNLNLSQYSVLQDKQIKSTSSGANFFLILTETNELYQFGTKYLDIDSRFKVFYTYPTLVDMTNVIRLLGSDYNIRKVVSAKYSAAILVNNMVFTWGVSRSGALGTGSTLHVIPTFVESLRDERIIDIDAGDNHMIALSEDGKIYEWGNITWRGNIFSTPQIVSIPDGNVRLIGAGNHHNFVKIDNCNLYVWGSFGTNTYYPPQAVNINCCQDIYSVSGGYNLVMAAIMCDESSYVVCVGDNSNYGCGSSKSSIQEYYPPQNPMIYLYNTSHDSLLSIYQNKYGTTLFVGEHISQVGKVMKYTNNIENDIPVSNEVIKVPTKINSFGLPSAKIHGSYSSFTFIVNNEVYLLGIDLGHYTGNHRYYPKTKYIDLIYNPKTLSLSNTHALNINKDKTIFLWGVLYPFLSPVPYPMNITSIIDFHCGVLCSGIHYVIFTNANGSHVYGYGKNKYGQLGLGDFTDRDYISQINIELEEDDSIVHLECGYYHTIALSNKGKVFGWGRATEGQLGPSITENTNIPIQLSYSFLNKVHSIHTGAYHTIIRDINNKFYYFGANRNTCASSQNGVFVLQLPFDQPVKSVSVGDFHNIFLTTDGSIYGCGSNYIQQISSSYREGSISRINEGSIQNKYVENVWAHGSTTHARTSDGDIHVWGNSPYRYTIFQNEFHLSLSTEPIANNVPTKLKMDGDLINKMIVDVYGNIDVIIYKVKQLPSSILCSGEINSECFINGTRSLNQNDTLNIEFQNVIVRGNLILSNNSLVNITGSLDSHGTIYAVEDGCIEVKQSILQYNLEEMKLENINNLKHMIIKGCHTGSFSEVRVILYNDIDAYQLIDCFKVNTKQIKENGNLLIEFDVIKICIDSNDKRNKIKWWGILLICTFVLIVLIIVALATIKIKNNRVAQI